ncbi:MAG TPA: hypothetical protein VJR50_21400 [Mycobacterium sp.]|nr:hypothetical protein [Mycobacterium sp.]
MGDDDLLELRIHGVNNTPPTSMLYAIQEEYGDPLVGVYGVRKKSVFVRALSWGGLARMTPIPRIPFVGLAQSLGSAAWIAVMPFGLANVAYWSRRLTMPGNKFEDSTRGTARWARIFSLGLTLLLASSVCSVSLDMAAGRLATALEPGSTAPQLPRWIEWLGHVQPGCRVAILSAAPLLAMLGLLGLAKWSRVRYDRGARISAPKLQSLGKRDAAPKSVWKFGDPEFWDNADLSEHNALVHTAAGIALTALWTGQMWFTGHLWVGAAVVAVSLPLLVGCVALIAYMPLVTEGNALTEGRKRSAWALFGASIVLFVVQTVALASWPTPLEPNPMAGLSFIPGALVFVLLVIAVAALGWRWQRKNSYLVLAVPVVLGGVVLLLHQLKILSGPAYKVLDAVLATALVVIAAVWLTRLYRSRARHNDKAWNGTAPGVLLILALFAALLLSTVFVMVGAALLGDGNIRINDAEWMSAPPLYVSFATTLAPVIVALLLLVVLVLVRTVFCCRTPIEPPLDNSIPPDPQRSARLAAIFDSNRVTRFEQKRCLKWCLKAFRWVSWWRLPYVRCRKRRLAAAAHRAEPMAAVVAAVAGLALSTGLVLALMLSNGAFKEDYGILPDVRLLGVSAAALIGAAIAGKGARRGRPLGIVWDLICFLPRAAHPFGPPCYAQRAVPELLDYCRAWLDTPVTGEKPRQRTLILSAHSLGGVLAVAIILLLSDDRFKGRVALVTYGCQLRAYFGRIFPELLGPKILGVTRSEPARLLACPTFDEPRSPAPEPGCDPPSVHATLTGDSGLRWINLWRPTDYLGFPAYSRQPNPVDRPADEVTAERSRYGRIISPDGVDVHTLDSSPRIDEPLRFVSTTVVRVDTHSDYFRARQYPIAISHLAAKLRMPET